MKLIKTIEWLRKNEANTIADKAKTKAWNDLKARYPNGDLSKFSAQVSFDDKRHATTEVCLNRSDGVQSSVSRSDRRYCDVGMKKALGIGGFPLELTLNRIGKKEVPAVSFHENANSRLHEEIGIFASPN